MATKAILKLLSFLKSHRTVVGTLLALTGGLAWNLSGLWGPALSVLLVIGISLVQAPYGRFRAALFYFLAGSWGIVPGAGTFFGSLGNIPGVGTFITAHTAMGHVAIWLLGVVLWLGSSVLLALPWTLNIAEKWYGILLVLVLETLPPLGLFGWLSPLTAAGVYFPGWGWAGLGVLLCCYWLVTRPWLDRFAALWFVVPLAVIANLTFSPPPLPLGWMGIDTHAGLMPADPLAVIEKNQAIIDDIVHHSHAARVVVLPETVAGYWWPGTANQFANAVPHGQLWLVGASVQYRGRQWDGLIPLQGGEPLRQSTPVFRAAFPVPVSMWHPWSSGGYAAAWWEREHRLAGQTVFASICYDQLLPWVWLEALVQRPQVILAVSNVWWARGTTIPGIERATSAAWGRVMGVPVVAAVNW